MCDQVSIPTKGGTSFLLLHNLNKEYGTTLIIITHDPEVAEQAQRVVHIRDGQLQEA